MYWHSFWFLIDIHSIWFGLSHGDHAPAIITSGAPLALPPVAYSGHNIRNMSLILTSAAMWLKLLCPAVNAWSPGYFTSFSFFSVKFRIIHVHIFELVRERKRDRERGWWYCHNSPHHPPKIIFSQFRHIPQSISENTHFPAAFTDSIPSYECCTKAHTTHNTQPDDNGNVPIRNSIKFSFCIVWNVFTWSKCSIKRILILYLPVECTHTLTHTKPYT